jgi:hypothetical protein
MKVAMTAGTMVREHNNEESSEVDYAFAVLALVFFLVTPTLILAFLRKSRNRIEEPEMREKFENLYPDLLVRNG